MNNYQNFGNAQGFRPPANPKSMAIKRLMVIAVLVVLSFSSKFVILGILLSMLGLTMSFKGIKQYFASKKEPATQANIFANQAQNQVSNVDYNQINLRASLTLGAFGVLWLIVGLNHYFEVFNTFSPYFVDVHVNNKSGLSPLVWSDQKKTWIRAQKFPILESGRRGTSVTSLNRKYRNYASIAWPVNLNRPGSIALFDPKNLHWKVENLAGRIPLSRNRPTLHFDSGKVLMWGGYRIKPDGRPQFIQNGGVIDFKKQTWESLSLPKGFTRALTSAATLKQNKVFAVHVNRFTGSGATINTHGYDLRTKKWRSYGKIPTKITGEFALFSFGKNFLVFPSTREVKTDDPLSALPAGSFLQRASNKLLELIGEQNNSTTRGYNQRFTRRRNVPVRILQLNRSGRFKVFRAPTEIQNALTVGSSENTMLALNENSELVICSAIKIVCHLPISANGEGIVLNSLDNTVATMVGNTAYVWVPTTENLLRYDFSSRTLASSPPRDSPDPDLPPLLFKINNQHVYLSGEQAEKGKGAIPFDKRARKFIRGLCDDLPEYLKPSYCEAKNGKMAGI